jgi:acyl-CoA dehydrogenase
MIGRFILRNISKFIPRISETERIALITGDTSIDRDIFTGKVKTDTLTKKFPKQDNIDISVAKTLTEKISPYHIEKRGYLNNYEFDLIKKSGLLGMIIPKKYDGLEYNYSQHSAIVTYLGSYSSGLAVSVMVPNSLGPAEWILHYGTELQKNYYLPKLSKGDMIPCFGLTTAWSGSDAANMPCRGEIFLKDGKLKIKLNLNKRYITLAPIADLIGVAFIVDNKNNDKSFFKSGISLAILERKKYPELDTSNIHDVGSTFWNGTIRAKDLVIDIDDVIGGKDGLGNGWKMLMECLSAGRGISLPAGAIGSSKFLLSYTLHYAQYRHQFKTSISNMEGVQLKLSNMILDTLTGTAGQQFFNSILDTNVKPTVISGILKYKCTEYGRNVVNNSMDILAGAGICRGPNNPISGFYNAMPISINVEGNNVLTRNLIIFGNGLLKSHPYLYPFIESIEKQNQKDSINYMYNIVKLFTNNYIKTFVKFNTYELQLSQFVTLSHCILLLGKKFKSSEFLSGRMADILSNLYFITALEWYKFYKPELNDLIYLSIKRLHIENQKLINEVIDNYPNKFIRLFLIKRNTHLNIYDYEITTSVKTAMNNINHLTEGIAVNNKYLELMKENIDKDQDTKNKISDQIIQVDTFQKKLK